MSTAFYHSNSYVLPLVSTADGAELDIFELDQEEVSASQALAIYRRVVDTCEMESANEFGVGAAVTDGLDRLSIDELRRLAGELRVAEQSTITAKAELIAAIR